MKKVIGYSLFTIITGIFFLYYYFPAKTAANLLKYQLRKYIPDLVFNMDSLMPVFPPGIEIKKFAVNDKNNTIFESKFLRVKPDFISILKAKPEIIFSSRAYSGDLKGDITVGIKSKDYPIDINFKWRNIMLTEISALNEFSKRITGLCAGNLKFKGLRSNLIDGTGNIEIKLSDGKIILEQSLLNLIKEFQYKSFEAVANYKEKTITIEQGTLNGDIEAKLSGKINIRTPFEYSILDITGKIRPSASFQKEKNLPFGSFLKPEMLKKGIPINIKGTISRPSMKLMP